MQKYLTGIHILACKTLLIHLPRQLAISLDVKNLSPTKKEEASVLRRVFILVAHICSFSPSIYPFRAQMGEGTKLLGLHPSLRL